MRSFRVASISQHEVDQPAMLLDPLARYEDASPDEEARQACVIEDLKEVATSLGFGGYQALIRAYISNGLRKHLAAREAQRAKDSTVEEFSRRPTAHGVPEQAIQDAAAEMKAER